MSTEQIIDVLFHVHWKAIASVAQIRFFFDMQRTMHDLYQHVFFSRAINP